MELFAWFGERSERANTYHITGVPAVDGVGLRTGVHMGR
jgi:hypothetical protein